MSCDVAADSGSTYEPHPVLTYEWDPDGDVQFPRRRRTMTMSFDLPPHPADHNTIITAAPPNGQVKSGPFVECHRAPGREIWVYVGRGGYVTKKFIPPPCTFNITITSGPSHFGASPYRYLCVSMK